MDIPDNPFEDLEDYASVMDEADRLLEEGMSFLGECKRSTPRRRSRGASNAVRFHGVGEESAPGGPRSERIPIQTPKDFDGSTPWVEYWGKFRAVSVANGWRQDTQVLQLKCHLTGAAGSLIFGNPNTDRMSIDDLANELDREFGDGSEHRFIVARKLEERRLGLNEPLYSLRGDITRWVAIVYPKMSAAQQESMALVNFTRALDNPLLVREVLKRDPRTLEEAYTIAKTELMLLATVNQPQSRKREVRGLEDGPLQTLVESLHKLTVEVAQLKAQLSVRECARTGGKQTSNGHSGGARIESTRYRNPRCFRCGLVGHRQGQCTSTGDGYACFSCGEKGHVQRNCPEAMPRAEEGRTVGRVHHLKPYVLCTGVDDAEGGKPANTRQPAPPSVRGLAATASGCGARAAGEGDTMPRVDTDIVQDIHSLWDGESAGKRPQVSAAVSVPAVARRRVDPLRAGPMGGRGGSGRADLDYGGENECEPVMPAGWEPVEDSPSPYLLRDWLR